MKLVVVDASVVIKAYIPEILSGKAESVMAQITEGDLFPIVPDLLFVEAGNVLRKKHRLHEISAAEAAEIIDAISALPVLIEESRPMAPLAVQIAIDADITVYDAMYLAVAKVHETKLLTADRRLVEALARTQFRDDVQWLGTGIAAEADREA